MRYPDKSDMTREGWTDIDSGSWIGDGGSAG